MRARISLLAVCSMILLSLTLPPVSASPSILISKLWGGTGRDHGNAITTDAAGSMYVTGDTTSFGPYSPDPTIFLAKYSASGSLLWQKIWSNTSETAKAIALDSSGNIFVAGYVSNVVHGGAYYGLLLKFNSTGGILWERNWGSGIDFPAAYGLAVDSTGNVYLAGETQNRGATPAFDALVMKFDPSGILLWQKTWGGSYYDDAYALALDSAGNLYVTGYTSSFNGIHSAQIFLLKISSAGSLLFEKIIGSGTLNEIGYGIAVDKANEIYLTGETCSAGAGNCDAIILKLDSTSGVLWQRTWGGSNGTDLGRAVAVDSSGDAFVTGETNSYGQGGTCQFPTVCYDIFLLEISPSGNLLTHIVYGGAGTSGTLDGHDFGRGVALDQYGNPAVVGVTGEAPPYILTSGNSTLGNATLPYGAYGNNTIADPRPLFTTEARIGTVGTPSGGETWQGTTKSLLFKYGTIPSGLPLVPGSILFAGLLASIAVLLSRPTKRRRREATTLAKAICGVASRIP